MKRGLLSFGDEMEEDAEMKTSGKKFELKSAHDILDDEKLSKVSAVQPEELGRNKVCFIQLIFMIFNVVEFRMQKLMMIRKKFLVSRNDSTSANEKLTLKIRKNKTLLLTILEMFLRNNKRPKNELNCELLR